MCRPLKVSVAVITYNGVSFIEEQLVSILNQTIKPDEVVISDDGSTDGTIELIKRIIDDYKDSGISITLLLDNPIHGIGSNFEWAVKHTTGEVVFSSGQDDVWTEDKIEKVLHVYNEHDDAKVVITDAYLIDDQGNTLSERFSPHFIDSLGDNDCKILKIERSRYIEYAESTTMLEGPVISFRSNMKELILPMPYGSAEDNWIEVIGVAENALYFLMEKTTYYRVHDSTTKSIGASFWKRIVKNFQRAKSSYMIALSRIFFGNALLDYYNNHPIDFEGRGAALETVYHIVSIGKTEIECMRSGRIKGSVGLWRLYRTDIRYRKSGFQQFLLSLLYIISYSKRKRNRDIDKAIAKYRR